MKEVVKSFDSLYIGGVAASLIPDLFEKETGLPVRKNIIVGLLDKSGILDDNEIIIDTLTPDYSILETISYRYPLDTGYLGYTTKGCRRGCEFCAVPRLEPKYKNRVSLKHQLPPKKDEIRKDLILMDNNVLDSPKFSRIIQEILKMGFAKDDRFVEPNRFEILTDYLFNSNKDNEQKYLQKIYAFLQEFGNRRIRNTKIREQYYQLLHERKFDYCWSFTKQNLLNSKDEINKFIEKYRHKTPKRRYVDFNQGLDCRYLDEEKMKLLSQLPIQPMRIAFDKLSLRELYEKAVRLAVKYGIRHLSNYILFNYDDTPEDLWHRLNINQNLNRELNIKIYSFPMKFVPMSGEDAKNRSFVGPNWSPKYLRAIQCILNVTRTGVVMDRPAFFEEAFGHTLEEYFEILMLPETYILHRNHFKENGIRNKWRNQWQNLNSIERKEAESIIFFNKFYSFEDSTSKAVVDFMKHYTLKYKPTT